MTERQRRPTQRAQQLRNGANEVERIMWEQLRGKRLMGRRFSRQMPVGPYICDFLCQSDGLAIELDGAQHAERTEYDAQRTAYLNEHSVSVLRFWNNEVLTNMGGVLTAIAHALENGPNPLPRAGGGS